jgi:acyl carrier protein
LSKIVWKVIDSDAVEITRETDLSALGIDSLDIVEVVMEAEDEFDLELIELDFLDPPYLAGQLVDAIDAKLAEKAGG